MRDARNLFDGVETVKDSDELVETLLNNPDIWVQ